MDLVSYPPRIRATVGYFNTAIYLGYIGGETLSNCKKNAP